MVLITLLGIALAGEGEPDGPAETLRGIVMRGSESGERPEVWVDLFGRRMRGEFVGADENGITARVIGNEMRIPWENFSPARLASLAAKLAKSGSEHLSVARYLAQKSLPEKAREACDRAVAADAALAKEAKKFLASLQKDEAKKGPDLSKILAVYAPEKRTVERRLGTNHEGRVLPPMSKITKPVMFNTPEADRILAAMQVFPKDNPWNKDITKNPVHPNSDNIIASLGADKRFQYNSDMCFIIVPPDQPRIKVEFTPYPGESDRKPYPIPDNAPIEGWPMHGGELERLQRAGSGDRHVIVVDPVNGKLYELFRGFRTDAGWKGYGCIFDLNSNKLRRRGWTSSDAAGLPIFPSIVRFDECERGMVEHAMRFTCVKTRREYLYPATHYASSSKNPDFPAMGQRFRLKADVDVSSFPKHARAIALGLKKYGMFMADNGGDWRMSTAPDRRIKGLRSLTRLKGSDFEVVVTYDRSGKPQH